MGDKDTTTDLILGGRVTLRQPAKGYRAAVDPLLLAAFVKALPYQRVLEIGSGTGAAILALNARVPYLQLTAVEPDASLRALLAENAALNKAAIEVVDAAVGGESWPVPDNAFDHVLFNPPFFDAGDYWPSPHTSKTQAHALRQPLAAWVKAAQRALANRKGGEGQLSAIITINQLPELLGVLHKSFGAIVMQPIQPRVEALASRMLVSAKLGRKTAPILKPPFILHKDGDQGYTAWAAAVLRDAAAIR